jgi:peptidyl-prolyl cis-trans isomerase D
VDVPKMGRKFLTATVQKNVEAFDATVDSVYRTADAFAASVKDTGTFRTELKKFKSGVAKYEQQNIDGASKSITSVTDAREIVKWIYNNDRNVNDVSEVFSIGDKQIVVLLTRIREKGLASVADVKDQVKPKIENEEKAKKITAKLNATGGDLVAIAKAYGSDATTGKATDITLSSSMITGVGYEPEAVGTIFGLGKGKTSQVLTGENGVLIVKNLNETKSDVADYSQFVSQLQQQRNNRIAYGVIETAIKESAEIEDMRYKF